MESSPVRSYLNRSFFSPSKIVGLLLVITGIIFLYNPNDLRLKVGASMILLGLFFLLFLNVREINIQKTISNQKFTFILVIWIFLVFIITYNFEADFFFIIVIIGIFIIKNLFHEYIGKIIQKRLNFMLIFFFIVFLVIVADKILIIINNL